jgi:membrane-bound ClpP family serine protease
MKILEFLLNLLYNRIFNFICLALGSILLILDLSQGTSFSMTGALGAFLLGLVTPLLYFKFKRLVAR